MFLNKTNKVFCGHCVFCFIVRHTDIELLFNFHYQFDTIERVQTKFFDIRLFLDIRDLAVCIFCDNLFHFCFNLFFAHFVISLNCFLLSLVL